MKKMASQSQFLPVLRLSERPLLAVQLLSSVFVVMVLVQSFFYGAEIIEGQASGLQPLQAEPSLWVLIVLAVCSLVPAVFVFNLLNECFDF